MTEIRGDDIFNQMEPLPAAPVPQLGVGLVEQYRALAPESQRGFREALVKAGYSPDDLAALGPEPPSRPATAPAIDAPESPDGYRLRHTPGAVAGLDASKFLEMDKAAKGAFHGAGVPPLVAQSLIDSLQETAAKFAGLAPAESTAARESEWATLVRIYGETKATQLRDDARAVAAKFNQKLDGLFPNGALSAQSIVSLANVAAVLKHKGKF